MCHKCAKQSVYVRWVTQMLKTSEAKSVRLSHAIDLTMRSKKLGRAGTTPRKFWFCYHVGVVNKIFFAAKIRKINNWRENLGTRLPWSQRFKIFLRLATSCRRFAARSLFREERKISRKTSGTRVMRSRLRRAISYNSLYFAHPSLELIPFFAGMRKKVWGASRNTLTQMPTKVGARSERLKTFNTVCSCAFAVSCCRDFQF